MVRDCQAAGRVILTCGDEHLASETFKVLRTGTAQEWAAAAAVVAGAAPAAAAATLRHSDSASSAAVDAELLRMLWLLLLAALPTKRMKFFFRCLIY